MPKVTLYGGHSIAGITDTATGSTERAAGFTDDTDRIKAQAAERSAESAGYFGDGGNDSGQVAPEPPFNPAELSVTEVNELLADASDDERALVLSAERAGKNRKGITGE